MPSGQSRIVEQVKFIYSPLGKPFEKQTETIEDQEIKQVEALKALKPEENQELESTEMLFPKKRKIMKLKMKQMKSKNREKKLNKEI